MFLNGGQTTNYILELNTGFWLQTQDSRLQGTQTCFSKFHFVMNSRATRPPRYLIVLIIIGCLKNLMLRILRGSYPAIPTKYSNDLKTLINAMLKKNPLDRPSLNAILRKKFIQKIEAEMNRPKAFQTPAQQIRLTQTKRAEKLYNRKGSKPRRSLE